jgi:CheY-like chemotaxis protein
MASEVPKRVILDGRHVRQVLLNLLGNAVKFTPQGEVKLLIGLTDHSRLRFDVIDTGIGIEAENLSAVFQAFRQTRSGAELGGTGLGLTISHRLVRGMGGELKVESAPGRGSRFYFELPLVEADEPSAVVAADADGEALSSDARLATGSHLTVLVADDSSVNRRILASLLESAGVRVITAAGGIEAVDLARAHRPDIVLMDLRMGDLSGFEATRRIVADASTASIPVIAVSASAWAEVRQQARDAGCVDFLPKPVKADVLFAKLQRYTRVRFVTPTADAEPALPPLSSAIEVHDLASRIREAAAIGSVADLDSLAEQLSAAGEGGGVLGRRIASLAAAFDYDALLRLAASLEQQPQ